MAEPLLLFETYSELISDVTGLVVSNKNLAANDLRTLVKDRLTVAKEQCVSYSNEQIRNAEFAVCAAVDEYVLAKHWLGSADWRTNLLQDEYFNTTDAGVLFYTRSEKLTSEQIDLLHLYFFCLATGFRGQYFALLHNDAIVSSMRGLLRKINHVSEETLLATQGLLVGIGVRPEATATKRWFEHTAVWLITPFLICLGLYGCFAFSLMHSVRFYLAAAS